MSAIPISRTWLLIFDPTLRSNDGHSRNYDFAVAEAALELFDRVVIFADAAFAEAPPAGVTLRAIVESPSMSAMRAVVRRALPRPDTGALPNASAGPSLVWLQRIWKYLRARGLAYSFRWALRDMGTGPGDRVHVFVQQADLYEIAGVDAFGARYGRSGGARVTFHLLMRHDPEITRAGQEDLSSFRARLLRLSQAVDPRVLFHTDSETIAADYDSLTGRKVPFNVMPIPFCRKPSACNSHPQGPAPGHVRISMMGASRLERGFGTLPVIIDNFPAFFSNSKTRARVHLQVQVNRQSADRNVSQIVQWLDAYCERESPDRVALSLREGPAPEDEYFSWFEDSDILIAPYVSSKYKKSTSGVFVEAIHLGIPAVVMSGTWAAGIVEAAAHQGLAIGEIAEEVGAIPGRVRHIWDRFPQYKSGMQLFRAHWKLTNARSIPNLFLAGAAPQGPADDAVRDSDAARADISRSY